MTIPSPARPAPDDPVPHDGGPLDTDERLLDYLSPMVEGAYRRQLWMVMLGDDHRPLPILPMIDIPERPDPEDPRDFGDQLCSMAELAGAAELVIVYERPGGQRLTEADRAWLRILRPREGTPIRMRGPLLAHRYGVRWLGPEDLG